MKKTTVAISVLSLALVASNAWWAYQLLDLGVSFTYQGASLDSSQRSLAQSLAVIKVISNGEPSREEVISAAVAATSDSTGPFEKEGFVWTAGLGLRFSPDGRLLEAVAN